MFHLDYDRWCGNYNGEIKTLNIHIPRLGKQETHLFKLLDRNLSMVTGIWGLFEKADTLVKQEFVKLGFDNILYHEKVSIEPLPCSVFYRVTT